MENKKIEKIKKLTTIGGDEFSSWIYGDTEKEYFPNTFGPKIDELIDAVNELINIYNEKNIERKNKNEK